MPGGESPSEIMVAPIRKKNLKILQINSWVPHSHFKDAECYLKAKSSHKRTSSFLQPPTWVPTPRRQAGHNEPAAERVKRTVVEPGSSREGRPPGSVSGR